MNNRKMQQGYRYIQQSEIMRGGVGIMIIVLEYTKALELEMLS